MPAPRTRSASSRPRRCTMRMPSTTSPRLQHDRQIDVRAAPHEPLRHDADDAPDATVQPQLRADDLRVAAELTLPEAIPEHDDRFGIRRDVGRREVASDERRHAHHLERVRRAVVAANALGLGTVRPQHVADGGCDRALEDRVALGDLEELVGRCSPCGRPAARASVTRTLIRLSTSLYGNGSSTTA